jgi:hypothetical protein
LPKLHVAITVWPVTDTRIGGATGLEDPLTGLNAKKFAASPSGAEVNGPRRTPPPARSVSLTDWTPAAAALNACGDDSTVIISSIRPRTSRASSPAALETALTGL